MTNKNHCSRKDLSITVRLSRFLYTHYRPKIILYKKYDMIKLSKIHTINYVTYKPHILSQKRYEISVRYRLGIEVEPLDSN